MSELTQICFDKIRVELMQLMHDKEVMKRQLMEMNHLTSRERERAGRLQDKVCMNVCVS